MEHLSDEFAEVLLTKLNRRYIDCYRHCGEPFVLPFSRLGAGGPEHPFTDGNDQPAVLRNPYELIGWHGTKLRVLPAEERFQTSDLSSADIHLRLIHEREFFVVECQSQAISQGQPFPNLRVHILREEAKVVAPALFGLIHSRIGILDQRFAVRAVFRKDADADAATDIEGVPLDDESSGHCVHEPFNGSRHAGYILYVSQRDQEFVATST